MRAISSSLMAALITMALLWGNCLSCPQLLLLARQSAPAHSCCHEKSAPKAPGAKECASQGLASFVKSDPAPQVHFTAVPASELPAAPVSVAEPAVLAWLPVPLHTPPGDSLPLRI